MIWHCVVSATLVVRDSCDAPDRATAIAKLKPDAATDFIVSDLSWRQGGFRPIAPPEPKRSQGNSRPRTDAERAKISASMKAQHAMKRRAAQGTTDGAKRPKRLRRGE